MVTVVRKEKILQNVEGTSPYFILDDGIKSVWFEIMLTHEEVICYIVWSTLLFFFQLRNFLFQVKSNITQNIVHAGIIVKII